MIIRALTIIALLTQLLALPSAMGQFVGSDGDACCTVVVQVTCCGEKVVEHDCAMPSGVCICEAYPDDTLPVPWAPGSRNGLESMPFFAEARGGVIYGAATVLPVRMPEAESLRRSPSQTRALLCIWRI